MASMHASAVMDLRDVGVLFRSVYDPYGGSTGTTWDQFCTCLKFKDAHKLCELSSQIINAVLPDGSADGGPFLSFVNGVWVDQSMTLKPSYRDLVKNRYKNRS